MYYGLERRFWMKLLLLLATFGLVIFIFNSVMRKLLKVERKELFSYNHQNDRHKKMDWTIRLVFMFTILFVFTIRMINEAMEMIWFLEPYFLTFIFILVSESVRAVMEWKYASNRKDYIFTISQLLFLIIILVLLFLTDFFGLLG